MKEINCLDCSEEKEFCICRINALIAQFPNPDIYLIDLKVLN